jgi:hypothetical protein
MASGLTTSVSSLRPNKRYIVTHDASGKSVYGESPDQQYFAFPGVGGMARSYSLPMAPVNLTDDADLKGYRAEQGPHSFTKPDIVVADGGANLLVIDLSPGSSSDLHQTVSIDFSICVMGEIIHELDSGEKVTLLPGV